MDIFKKKNDENNIWMGFHKTHGWVILDRNIKVNKSDGNYFIKYESKKSDKRSWTINW